MPQIMWLSPNIRSNQISDPPTLDEKINVFEDRVIGWQLDIADLIINGRGDRSKIDHAGFAVLSIVLSYFELIAKFEDGRVAPGDSGLYFRRGVHSLFPNLANFDQGHVDALLDRLYEGARCGMYHAGMTGSGIFLFGDPQSAIVFHPPTQTLTINPHLLVPLLKDHFRGYMARLRNPAGVQLRQSFERRFDAVC